MLQLSSPSAAAATPAINGLSTKGLRMVRVLFWVAAIAFDILATGCSQFMPAKNTGPEGMLAGTAWQLQQLGAQGGLEAQQPTLDFDRGGKVSGSGSCNRFNGTVT